MLEDEDDKEVDDEGDESEGNDETVIECGKETPPPDHVERCHAVVGMAGEGAREEAEEEEEERAAGVT